jgi:hypothetical protein
VDAWIAEQFRKKNGVLQDKKEGIFIIDRCPLDPIAFTDAANQKAKARFIRDKVRGDHEERKIANGEVLFLKGDPETLHKRLLRFGSSYDRSTLEQMGATLQQIYQPIHTLIDTKDASLDQVVREVAHCIHMRDYVARDIHARLEDIVSNGP